MDGQYLNEPFITAMNEPIRQQLGDDLSCKDAIWWPIQWDPVHWLDKVFSKFKDSRFLDCLLKRVALYHHLLVMGRYTAPCVTLQKICIGYESQCPSAFYELQLLVTEEPGRQFGGVQGNL